MISVEAWLPYVLPDAPGCPESVVLREVMSALVEFSQRTHIWEHTTDPIPAVAGVSDYVLDVPKGTKVARLLSVRFNGRSLKLKTIDELDRLEANWRFAEGTPNSYAILDSNEIILNRIPKVYEADAISSSFALMPQRDADQVPSFFFDDWLEEIASGAKSRLLLMPDRAWSDPEKSIFYKRQFSVGVSRAIAKRNTANGTRSLIVSRPRII